MTGDKCVPKTAEEEKKEQGKCPDGKKLDPNVPGQVSNARTHRLYLTNIIQDELTENAKCIDKNDADCPAGQSKTTTKPGECLPDDKPDHKCNSDKGDLDAFKDKGPDDKIRHTCRSNEKKEKEKKAAYEKNRTELVNKLTSERKQKEEKKEK